MNKKHKSFCQNAYSQNEFIHSFIKYYTVLCGVRHDVSAVSDVPKIVWPADPGVKGTWSAIAETL